MRHMVISYDIANDRRRAKISRILEDHGVRVQYSVFEASLKMEQAVILLNKLDEMIDPSVDSIRYYYLCARCIELTAVQGRAVPAFHTEDVCIV